MARVDVVVVPGIGALRTFRTDGEDRIAVLALPSGRRQLFVEDPNDPDHRQMVAELSREDCQVLAELLGGPLLELQAGSEPDVAAVLDWVRIDPTCAATGTTIGQLRLRTETGATVAAVIRDDSVHADPDHNFELHGDDVLVVSGGTESIKKARALLTRTNVP